MHFLPENRMCAPPFATKQRPPIWKILDPPLTTDIIFARQLKQGAAILKLPIIINIFTDLLATFTRHYFKDMIETGVASLALHACLCLSCPLAPACTQCIFKQILIDFMIKCATLKDFH